ncbi:MAG TPA: helix-turn-helix domain-containing protein [Candidatus Saccharimonadales bacterium]|nr:helix-turn-helix domain-containing protein [Candidatus Saccharimonadales bacterium]
MDTATNDPMCKRLAAALKILGDKWSSLIIQQLTGGPRRFCEIEHAIGIGPRTLSQRLDVLEQQEVVAKKQFNEVPPRVEYSLTEKGADLLPILESMAVWAAKYPGIDGDQDKRVP